MGSEAGPGDGATARAPVLEVRDLAVRYGAIQAVRGISFSVARGEIVCIIGANGAGKSSTLRSIMGLVRPERGSIRFDGTTELSRLPPHRIARLGVGYVPEGRRMLAHMTVLENLRVAAENTSRRGAAWEAAWEQASRRFPVLKARHGQLAGLLSGGEQQMAAIARALMVTGGPRLLLLDEPSMGLAPLVVRDVFRLIREVHENLGTAILLVEQNARRALQIANRGYVLEMGRIVLEGTASELLHHPRVQQAYLGGA